MSVSAANKVRRGDIRHAVVVRTAKKYQRPDGSVVKFDDNACVLINKGGDPIGSRMNGKHFHEQRQSRMLTGNSRHRWQRAQAHGMVKDPVVGTNAPVNYINISP